MLPGTGLSATKIQELMVPETLAALKKVSTAAEAKAALGAVGLFYVCRATFGCLATFTSVVEASDSTSTAKVSAEMEASASNPVAEGSVSGSHKLAMSSAKFMGEERITIRRLGGKPLDAADEAAWLATADQAPVVIKYGLAPVYTLLGRADAENESAARKLLETAFEQEIASKVTELAHFAGLYDQPPVAAPLPAGGYFIECRGGQIQAKLEDEGDKLGQLAVWGRLRAARRGDQSEARRGDRDAPGLARLTHATRRADSLDVL